MIGGDTAIEDKVHLGPLLVGGANHSAFRLICLTALAG